jgi:hypothetical protein
VKIQHGCQPGKDGNSTSWGPSATTPRQEEVKGEELFSERKSIEVQLLCCFLVLCSFVCCTFTLSYVAYNYIFFYSVSVLGYLERRK